MITYIKNNLLQSFYVLPWQIPLKAWAPVPFYILFAAVIGFAGELLQVKILKSDLLWLLPFTLLVFPSLLEEMIFRGILIPIDTNDRKPVEIARTILWSTLAFVIWHPLNAFTVNPSAIPLFSNPAFLAIVAALGLTCGYSYVVSRSIWAPVLIHWITVLVWVLFLNGRNLLLEA